jgi:hypothetical protein
MDRADHLVVGIDRMRRRSICFYTHGRSDQRYGGFTSARADRLVA